jgi:hypothetical protein
MGGDERGAPAADEPYGAIRGRMGVVLLFVGSGLMVGEPVTHLHPDPIELGLLFGTGLLLLGIQAGRALLR